MADKQASAMERIITVLQVLADHPARGVDVSALLQAAQYRGEFASQKDMLIRDIRHLNKVGYRIDNVAGEGEDARYVLRPVDDRVRLSFTKDQLFQLQRAAVLVGVDRLGPAAGASTGSAPSGDGPTVDPIRVPDVLDAVQRAVRSGAKIAFDYSGRRRTIHPYGLLMAVRGWALDGWEEESGQAKVFNLQKMSSVRLDRPGTASPPERSQRPTLDPLSYELDVPATAVLRVPVRFRQQVEAVLHNPLQAEPAGSQDGEATELLTYRVTNRTNFVVRVLRLAERVTLIGDEAMRGELRQMLQALVEVD